MRNDLRVFWIAGTDSTMKAHVKMHLGLRPLSLATAAIQHPTPEPFVVLHAPNSSLKIIDPSPPLLPTSSQPGPPAFIDNIAGKGQKQRICRARGRSLSIPLDAALNQTSLGNKITSHYLPPRDKQGGASGSIRFQTPGVLCTRQLGGNAWQGWEVPEPALQQAPVPCASLCATSLQQAKLILLVYAFAVKQLLSAGESLPSSHYLVDTFLRVPPGEDVRLWQSLYYSMFYWWVHNDDALGYDRLLDPVTAMVSGYVEVLPDDNPEKAQLGSQTIGTSLTQPLACPTGLKRFIVANLDVQQELERCSPSKYALTQRNLIESLSTATNWPCQVVQALIRSVLPCSRPATGLGNLQQNAICANSYVAAGTTMANPTNRSPKP